MTDPDNLNAIFYGLCTLAVIAFGFLFWKERAVRKFVWTWAQIIMGADAAKTRRRAGAKFRKSRAAKQRESEQAELRG